MYKFHYSIKKYSIWQLVKLHSLSLRRLLYHKKKKKPFLISVRRFQLATSEWTISGSFIVLFPLCGYSICNLLYITSTGPRIFSYRKSQITPSGTAQHFLVAHNLKQLNILVAYNLVFYDRGICFMASSVWSVASTKGHATDFHKRNVIKGRPYFKIKAANRIPGLF